MIKKIIGGIGLVGGLGLALLVLLYFLTPAEESPPPAPVPAVQPQGGGQPVKESPPPAATPDSPPVVPAATESAADAPAAAPAPAPAPPVATVPTPEPAAQEKEMAPGPPAKPQKEHGLLVGKYRTYSEAKKRLTRITKQSIPAFIRKHGKYFEVWAGPFGSSQEAARAQKSLKAAMKIAAQQKKIAVPVPK